MKNLFINIKNFSSYLLLILIYFTFINIEARNDQYESNSLKRSIKSNEYNNEIINDKSFKHSIPIIPFNEMN
mgnify:CR=1 FL=1